MKIVAGLITFFILFFSSMAFADKIIISGEPVIIEKHADVYIPSTTVTTQDYYYFSVDNTRRVCYKEVQPALTKIDAGIFAVKFGADVVRLHCYDYAPEYFVIE